MAPRVPAGLLALAVAWRAAAEGADAESRSLRDMNMGVSVMLLGSVAFMMGLFYLTNQTDKKKATDSWKVISATISIFSAVLLFQGISGVVDEELVKGTSKPWKLALALAQMLVWLFLLQVFLAYISGAVGSTPEDTPENRSNAKLNVECFAVLLGHISGFAAIKAFAIAQEMLPEEIQYKFLAVPISWGSISALGKLFDYVREAVCVADDGQKDYFEELWDDMAEETEDDVVGLTASFLTAQTLRFWITGNMPNAEGDENEAQVKGYSNLNVSCLVGLGLVMVAIEGTRLITISKTFGRFTSQLQNVMAMIMAWNLFFGTGWFMAINFPSLSGMLKHVVVALGLTAVSMVLIFALDTIERGVNSSYKRRVSFKSETEEDRRRTAHEKWEVSEFIDSCVTALAILIGFSWEKSFDVAVEAIAGAAERVSVPPHITKLLMGVVLAGVVVPAWRLHILPHIEKMEEELKEERGKEKMKEEQAEEPAVRNQSLEKRSPNHAIAMPMSFGRLSDDGSSRGEPGDEGQQRPAIARGPAVACAPARSAGASGSGRLPAAAASGSGGAQAAASAARGAATRLADVGGGGGLHRPLLADGRAAAGHAARMAELAGLKAEVDGKLDAVIAQLDVLDSRSAELAARARP